MNPSVTADRQPAGLPTRVAAALLILVFVSGASALLYQILWMRALSLVFGNAAHASAATLAAFFLGLGLGSRILGRAVSASGNSMRAFAILELGVVVGALWFVLVVSSFDRIAPLVEEQAAGGLAGLARFLLAGVAMLPATFCMGGTLPALAEAVAGGIAGLGRRVTLVYAVNTLGGTLGVVLGAFVLPVQFGYRVTLAGAVVASLSVAALAWLLSRRSTPMRPSQARGSARWRPSRSLVAAATLSGAAALALEVLWTRMFAQVFHNSVYSFGAVLVTFLLALAIGAMLARALARSRLSAQTVLLALWVASGLLVGVTPFVFEHVTQGMGYVGRTLDFPSYVVEIFITTMLVLLLPVSVMGAIFPYLLHVAETEAKRVGETVGDLAALNVLGAVAGSIAAGFLLLGWLGLWGSIGLVATLYVLAAAVLVPLDTARRRPAIARITPAVAVAVLVTVLNPAQLEVVRFDRRGGSELPVEHWEGPHGVVAVMRRDDALALKINNFYTLGSTAGAEYERRQGRLPLAIHAHARSVFFLGLGTGITAGAALDHPIESLTVAELTGDVVVAARAHFAPYTNELFSDRRVRILVEDGRSHLAHTGQRFDVIVGDLFVPWRAGVGALYTREHFATARQRLRPGGIFCQWLPMFQLDERGFRTIARTFIEVFPETTVWRGDFFGRGSILALIGHTSPLRLSPERLALTHQAFAASGDTRPDPGAVGSSAADFLLYYAGNLGMSLALLEGATVDTDDRSLLGFHAPVAQRQVAAGRSQWFDGVALMDFLTATLALSPPERDPVLADLDETAWARVRAGLALHRAQALRHVGNGEEAARLLARFRRLVRPASAPSDDARAALRDEIEKLRADLDRRLRSIEQRLPPLERPQ